MPNRDGTGPFGGGNRGLGSFFGFGRGRGFGRGLGMGRGLGWGLGPCRRGFGVSPDELSEREELMLLSKSLRDRLDVVNRRIEELGGRN